METNKNNNFNAIAKFLAKALGIFWIIDGMLQLQPKMFGQDFISTVLAPNLVNQPKIIESLINFGIKIYSYNIALANVAVIIIQLGIGALLLFPNSTKKFKAGLYLSIGWGLIVWIFGEGLGNIFAGSASFYNGAPGSVLIYVLIAAVLLFVAAEKISAKFLAKIAGSIFIIFAFLQFQPGIWSQASAATNWLLIAAPIVLGILLIAKLNKFTAGAALIFLVLVWWLGQDFGGLSTLIVGTSTDPNTAPMLMLLLIPAFFRTLA